MRTNTPLRKWLKNLSRTVVVILGCTLSIVFMDSLDQFLGVSGALLGISICLIVPLLSHYQLVATTKKEKAIDIGLTCFSFVILCLCAYNGILAWAKD